MIRSSIPFALVTLLVVLLLASAPASANTQTFTASTPISIPQEGSATPSPAANSVDSLRGPVIDLEVTLNKVTHTRPEDLDVLLVAPDGSQTVLMSDACGDVNVSSKQWTFKSGGVLVPDMGFGTACPGAFYRATNHPPADRFPGAPTGLRGLLTQFHRKAMNGEWRLYVVDDQGGDSGSIAGGWTLALTTGPVDMLVPNAGTLGSSSRYPSITSLGDTDDEVLADLDVIVPGVAHDRPDDLDMLLVGPDGQQAMLMSDACGGTPTENTLIFDDEASRNLPDGNNANQCGGVVKPANFEDFERLPSPAPDGLPSNLLEIFDGSDPRGDWRLYVADDSLDKEGYVSKPFELRLQSRLRATVELTEGAVSVAEGSTRTVTITRSAAGALGEAFVFVKTFPGSAAQDEDFTDVAEVVRFGPGQRERTVQIDARADALTEGAESYSVALNAMNGDARLGARTRTEVTIPAPAAGAGPGATAAAPRCGGKRATIVGTARRDVLRGTRRADVIVALGGNDTVNGARGNDIVCAGSGNDRVLGESGRDRLHGGAGRDRLYGASGNDRLTGDRGRDTCLGGRGRDRIKCERKR